MQKKLLLTLVILIGIELLISINTVTSVLPKTYNPSAYNVLGSTAYVSGALSDLQTNNSVYMTFRSYATSTSGQTLYAHQETTTIGGTAYYLQKLVSADAAGTSLSTSIASSGRQLWGKFVYPLTGVISIPASTWTIYYRAWHSTVPPQYIVTNSPGSTSGVWTDPTYAYADDTNFAYSATRDQQQKYGGYGFSLPLESSISQVRVRLDAKAGAAINPDQIKLEVSIDGGTTFLATSYTSTTLTTAESTIWVDVTGWTTWTVDKINSDKIWTRVTQVKAGGQDTTYLDWIPIEVSYAYPPSAHADVDILIRQSDGTVRNTIATNVADSANLTTTATTFSGTYSWSEYTVVDQTDYLEIDYYVHVTTAASGVNAYLRIDDNTLTTPDQTRATNIMLPSQYTAELEFTGSSNTETWTQLLWVVDSAWTEGSVSVTLQLYNYTLAGYPTSGDGYIAYTSSSTANFDETKSQTITTNPADFRDVSGNWKIKVTGVKATTTQFDFKADFVKYESTGVNNPPVLDPIGSKSVNELELLTFTATASDPDLDPLTFSLGEGAPPGTSIGATTGVFTWTPTEAQGPGDYTVRVIVSDGSLTDYEDVSVTVYEVNLPPVLDPIGAKSVNELELLTFTATASDPDIPAQTLTFSLGAGAPEGASIGATSGVFTWTPTEAQGPGDYTIRIIVSDGSLEDYEDISVTVTEVNAPPVLDPIGSKSVDELVLLTFTATASDPDIPPQTLSFSLGAGAPTGASIDSVTGVFTWTPTEAQGPGGYTIRVIVSDGSLEDYEDVSVTVNEVNLAPVLDPIGAKSVDELQLLTFTATASDSDIPVQSLTFSLGAGAPEGASIDANTGVFTWTPTEAQGPDVYTIRIIVSDGALEDFEDISVTVSEVNSAPVLDLIGSKSVNELELLTFTATASDSDLPPQTLSFSLGAGAPPGASITSAGLFTWTPTEAQGPNFYTIRIIVSDGSLEDYEDIDATVNEVNLAPVLDPIGSKSVNELELLTFTATASDPDLPAQALTFSLGAGAPTGASIDSITGVFTWTPTEAQGPGVYAIRVIVSDGSLEDYEDVSVTVNEVNLAPVLDPVGDKIVDELTLLTFTATASDPDLPLQILWWALGAGAPEGASIDAPSGVFTWTPTEAQGPGVYTIRVIVFDGSLEDYEDIEVTVNEVNLAPVLDPIGDKVVDELTLLTFTATASDPDLPPQTLMFSLGVGAPAGASIDAATGVFTWTPSEAQGPDVHTIRIIVSDGSLTDYEDVSVTVNEVNVPPVLDPIGPKSVNELELLTFTASATDTDIPSQALTFSLGAGAPTGASIDATTGVFSWIPTEAQGPGVYTIRIIVSDSLLEDFEDVEVTVNEVTEHDVAVLSVTPSGTQVYEGNPFNITVVVENKVAAAETFDVYVYAYNVTYSLNYTVGTQSVTLGPLETKTLTFPWDTTIVRLHTVYTIEAKALLPDDSVPSDNTLTDGTVYVELMGNVNGDGVVDVFDLIKIGIAFGSKPGDGNWNPDADLNNDGIIDVFDLILTGINFGRTAP